MRDRFPLVIVGGFLLLAVAGSYLFRGAERGRFADMLSTFRSEPDGARALFLLAEESGVRVARHQANLEVLEDGASYALIGVYPEGSNLLDGDLLRGTADGGTSDDDARDAEFRDRGMNAFFAPRVTEEEQDKLLAHVARGNDLLYVSMGDPDDSLLSRLGASLVPVEGSEGVRFLVPPLPSPWTLGVSRAQAEVQTHLELPEHGLPLLVDEQLGGVVAALIPHGQGRVVVLSAPQLAMNRRLGQADNAQLWVSLLSTAAGRVLFDEFHHGFTDDRSIAAFAARYGLHFAILQLLLGTALWAVAMRRFGRPRVPEQEERVGAMDALFASSRIYREGRHYGWSATLIARGLAQDLAVHAGLSPRAAPREITDALRARGESALATELEQVTREAELASSEQDVERCSTRAALLRQSIHEKRSKR